MVLVVRDPGQARVERHHDERELGQGAQQARSVPGETGLQVKLEGRGGGVYCGVGGEEGERGDRRRTLTTRYSMVYMEKEACPEKNDFLWESRA